MRAVAAILVASSVLASAVPAARANTLPAGPLGHAGRWLTDAQGRVFITNGVNMVYKRAPYAPDHVGFDDADAAFLAANGFESVRVGLIWKAVEPQPGVYDDNYLARIERTVRVLASRGIVSLLDFHQDMYNERFQGEGAPDWAVQDDGLQAEPKLGFPNNYLFMDALNRAYDHFLANDPGPGGIGLQDRYAAAWAHVAARFRSVPGVMGYDLFNEPWPGSAHDRCTQSGGCPVAQEGQLTAMQRKVVRAIRASDPTTMVFGEPFLQFAGGYKTGLGPLNDANAGFSFHDYCVFALTFGFSFGCDSSDDKVFANAETYSQQTGAALVLTEFGATDDATVLSSGVRRAAKNRVSWMYWHYCGCNDPTTTGAGDKQALVRDPARAPTGDNVIQSKLKLLAVPHPRLVSGTPLSYSFDTGSTTFRLSYSTKRAGGSTVFPAGAESTIAVPALQYPRGYRVTVSGARVVSAANAPVLVLASLAGATHVNVTVAPAASQPGLFGVGGMFRRSRR